MAESKSAALPLGYAPMRRKARTALAESGRTIVRGPPRRNGRGGRNLLPPKGARARLTRSTRNNAFGRVTRRAIPSLKGQTSSRHGGGVLPFAIGVASQAPASSKAGSRSDRFSVDIAGGR